MIFRVNFHFDPEHFYIDIYMCFILRLSHVDFILSLKLKHFYII